MSYIFGAARQNGFIVDDLDHAIHHWASTTGAGPFFALRHIPFEYFTYHGKPSTPDISLALGYLGDLEIELIEQHNDAPSPYKSFFSARGTGMHHMSSWTQDYDGHMTDLADRGRAPDCEGRIAGAARFAYFNSDAVDGSAFEVSDLGSSNEFGIIHDLVQQASVGWNGTDPIRSFG